VVLRDERQPLLLLLLGAEAHQRLGDADRLVGREEGGERGVPGAGQHQRTVVVDLREAEPAVLLGHLHAERAERLEPVDDAVGDLRLALDRERVDLVDQERAQACEERLALLDRRGVELRLRVDQVESQVAEEQLLAEAGLLPALAGALGDLSRLFFGDLAGHGAPRVERNN
jgi:hypothetical protein